MKKGDLLNPGAVHVGQRVIVQPLGDVSAGPGRGAMEEEEKAASDYLIGCAQRGSVLLWALPAPDGEVK